jgi:hypothetical protein
VVVDDEEELGAGVAALPVDAVVPPEVSAGATAAVLLEPLIPMVLVR